MTAPKEPTIFDFLDMDGGPSDPNFRTDGHNTTGRADIELRPAEPGPAAPRVPADPRPARPPRAAYGVVAALETEADYYQIAWDMGGKLTYQSFCHRARSAGIPEPRAKELRPVLTKALNSLRWDEHNERTLRPECLTINTHAKDVKWVLVDAARISKDVKLGDLTHACEAKIELRNGRLYVDAPTWLSYRIWEAWDIERNRVEYYGNEVQTWFWDTLRLECRATTLGPLRIVSAAYRARAESLIACFADWFGPAGFTPRALPIMASAETSSCHRRALRVRLEKLRAELQAAKGVGRKLHQATGAAAQDELDDIRADLAYWGRKLRNEDLTELADYGRELQAWLDDNCNSTAVMGAHVWSEINFRSA